MPRPCRSQRDESGRPADRNTTRGRPREHKDDREGLPARNSGWCSRWAAGQTVVEVRGFGAGSKTASHRRSPASGSAATGPWAALDHTAERALTETDGHRVDDLRVLAPSPTSIQSFAAVNSGAFDVPVEAEGKSITAWARAVKHGPDTPPRALKPDGGGRLRRRRRPADHAHPQPGRQGRPQPSRQGVRNEGAPGRPPTRCERPNARERSTTGRCAAPRSGGGELVCPHCSRTHPRSNRTSSSEVARPLALCRRICSRARRDESTCRRQ